MPDFAELWRYRDLLWMLTIRNVFVVYRQSILGAAWAVIRPLVSMVVFTLIFGRLAGFDSKTGDVPYPLFTFAALLPWMFFSTCLANTTQSIVGNADMISKIYFPRLILPLSRVGSALVDFTIQLAVLAVLLVVYQVPPTPRLLALPLFLLLAIIASLAAGLWLTALNVKYRDIGHAVPFLVQIWMYLSPVVYPTSELLAKVPALRPVYHLNPMVGVIDGFRWCLLGTPPLQPGALLFSVVVTCGFFCASLAYFTKTERTFADLI